MVYSWFDVEGGTDPFPDSFFADPWDDANPRQTTCVVLVRTEVARAIGGWRDWDTDIADMLDDPGVDEHGNRAGEDFAFVNRLVKAKAKIVHVPKRTWRWHHHFATTDIDQHTMGLPSRW